MHREMSPCQSSLIVQSVDHCLETVRIKDSDDGSGVGALDFLDNDEPSFILTKEDVEKWWCLGDVRNREAVWVQGSRVWPQVRRV